MHTQESRKGMKKLRKDKFRKILAFMVALALMVSCVPSAYTVSYTHLDVYKRQVILSGVKKELKIMELETVTDYG